MAITHEKSVYSDICDDVRFDLNEDVRLAGLTDEAIQNYILQAEQAICDQTEVPEEWTLSLTTDVDEYAFQDRPAISDATNATPIVVTAVGHTLSNTDIIFISGVLGNIAANGTFRIKNKTADTFELTSFVRVTDATNASPIVITTEDVHGFTTGNSITLDGVLGNTAANGTFTITVVSTTTFSLDASVGNGAYTSGGFAAKNVAGDGAYSSGGRFWKTNEIPTYFKNFKLGERVYSNLALKIIPASRVNLSEFRSTDGYATHTAYSSPQTMAVTSKLGNRYLKFYPVPKADEDITLFGQVRIVPKLYRDDPLTANIHLNSEYDDLIQTFVRAQLYKWLKDRQNSSDEMKAFRQSLNEFRQHKAVNVRRTMVYD